jgi:SAM-dependent methyltransferase
MGEAKKRKAEIEAIKARAVENMLNFAKEFEAIGFNFKGEKSKTAPTLQMAAYIANKCGRYDEVQPTLDIACGYGPLLLMKMLYDVRVNGLSPQQVFLNAYGNDPSPECVDVCKENFRKFARYFDINEHIVDFVLETHFFYGDEESAYKGPDRAWKWLYDHKTPCAMRDDGIILAVAL